MARRPPSDVINRFNADRQYIDNRGGELDRLYQDRWDREYNRGNWYGDQAGEIYDRMEGEDGLGYGLSPEEWEGIRQQKYADRLGFDTDEAQDMFLTGDEEWGLTGQPDEWLSSFDAARQNQMARNYGEAGRNAIGQWDYEVGQVPGQTWGDYAGVGSRFREGTSGVMEGLDRGYGGVEGSYRGDSEGTAEGEREGMRGYLDPSAERMRGIVGEGREDALSGMGISPRYADRMEFTDQDANLLAAASAGAAALPFQRAMAETRQAAEAGGNVNALALGSRLAATANQQAPAVAQANREARAQARQMMLNTEQQREDTRLRAEQARAGATGQWADRGLGVEEGIVGRDIASEGSYWDRIGRGQESGTAARERGIGAGANVDMAGNEGQMRAEMEGAGEAARQRYGSRMALGEGRLRHATDAEGRIQDTDWRNQTTLADANRQTEMERQRRMAQVNLNRQGVRQDNVGRRNQYNFNAGQFGRQGTQYGVDARRDDVWNAARGWDKMADRAYGGSTQAGAMMGDQFRARTGAYGQNSNQFADAYNQALNRPGWLSKTIGAVSGLAGAAGGLGWKPFGKKGSG